MTKTFSPKDFLDAIQHDSLKEMSTVEGMAKEDEKNVETLLFTASGCDSWIPIPLDLISTIDYINSIKCKDHQHPYVRIHFKPFDSPQSKMLSALLSSHTAALNTIKSSINKWSKPKGFCQKFCSECSRCDDPDCDACTKCYSCFKDDSMSKHSLS